MESVKAKYEQRDFLFEMNGFIGLEEQRLVDIFGSLAGLILLSPLFLMVALAIKMEDPKGPVFFAQKRNAKYPKTFDMYKFRSMVCGA